MGNEYSFYILDRQAEVGHLPLNIAAAVEEIKITVNINKCA
jgi:hypothetical protein